LTLVGGVLNRSPPSKSTRIRRFDDGHINPKMRP
jgi:hypothetical protein